MQTTASICVALARNYGKHVLINASTSAIIFQSLRFAYFSSYVSKLERKFKCLKLGKKLIQLRKMNIGTLSK